VLLVAGPAVTIGAAAVLFAAAAVAITTIRIPAVAAAVTAQPAGNAARPPVVAGFQTLVERPGAGMTIVGLGCQVLARGLLTTLIVVASIELLGLGEGGVGALNAAIGAGGFVGAAGALGLTGRSRLAPIYALALSGWGLPIALIGLVPNAALAIAAMLFLGTSNAILDITAFTLLQRTLPNERRTAVFAFLEGVIGVGIAAGGVLAPLLVAVLGSRGALVLTGALLPAAAILTWPWVSRFDRETVVPERELMLLRQIPMFGLLPLTMLERLARALTPQSFKANELVMREGEPGDRYYIVASGNLEVTSEGRYVGTNGPGDGIGEIALLRQVPRTATVRTTEDSELYALAGADFLSAITDHLGNARAADILIDARLTRSRGRPAG
jgi:MFS family permease